MVSVNVSLPDPMQEWVEGRIESGGYASASEYVLDLIRRDRERADTKLALLDALIEGEQRGVSDRRVADILASVREDTNGRA